MTDVENFSDLKFKPFHYGQGARVEFDNYLELSVVQHSGSYGNQDGLYEIAVRYKTPWRVKGYLTEEDVTKIMGTLVKSSGTAGGLGVRIMAKVMEILK